MPREQNRRQAGPALSHIRRVQARAVSMRVRGTKRVLALVFLCVLFWGGAVGASALTIRLHRASDLLAASPIGPATNAVIFVVDGLGPAELAGASTPNIDDLARRGVTYRNAWVGQLESVGPTSNATIATGRVPARHGVVGLEWRGSGGSLVRPTTPQQVQLGTLDQTMEARNTKPLASLIKDRYPRARILSAGGVGCADANAAGSWLADYIICPLQRGAFWVPGAVTGHNLPAGTVSETSLRVRVRRDTSVLETGWNVGQEDDWLTTYAITAMRRTHPILTIINFPEIAAIKPGASASIRSGLVESLVRSIDADIGRVVAEERREKIANRTVFLVTSDGALSEIPHQLPASVLGRAVTAAGGQEVYRQLGQTSFLGLRDTLQAQPVAQALQNEQLRGIDGLYYKTISNNIWQYQPQYLDPDLSAGFADAVDFELRTLASSSSPDVAVVCSPGFGLVAAGNRGQSAWSGLGLQWETQHIPFILAGHGVLSGGVSDHPARLVDVAPTLTALMDLGSAPSDGVILADGLAQPGNRARRSQNAALGRELPLIQALRSRLKSSSGS